MIAENIAVDDQEQTEEALDRAFDVLAHSYRRTVIEELERDAPLDVGDLAERIAHGTDATTRSVEVELAHRHLPRLDDAGVVTYDATSRQCELDRAETVRSIFDTVREVT